MSTIEARKNIKTHEDYLQEIYSVAGVEGFPVSLQVSSDGTLLAVSIDSEWREGGTMPIVGEVEVEKTIVVDGVEETIQITEMIVSSYEENFVEKSLTQKQVTALEAYLTENIS